MTNAATGPAAPTTRYPGRLSIIDGLEAVPLLTYDSRRGESIAEHLSLQGNPALREDWQSDGSVFDFVALARTEGRSAPHVSNGELGPGIRATQAARLAKLAPASRSGRHRAQGRRPPARRSNDRSP